MRAKKGVGGFHCDEPNAHLSIEDTLTKLSEVSGIEISQEEFVENPNS